MKLPVILTTTFAAFATLSADAALITWGTATTISGDADVSTSGTLVDAFTFGSLNVSATTVNGVTFAAFGVSIGAPSPVTVGNYSLASSGGFLGSGSVFGSAAAPFSSLSASYQSLLNTAAGAGAPDTLTLTMAGLTVGANYQFQWWTNGSNFPNDPVTAAAGNSVSLNTNTAGAEGGVGQFAIGTFVADSASQAITFSAANGFTAVNGFQLRALAPVAAVPEPGTALAGLAAMGLCAMRRRTKR